jgi:hypothetical protein
MARLIVVIAIAATMIGQIAPVAAAPAADGSGVQSDVEFAAMPEAFAGLENQGSIVAGNALSSPQFHAGDKVDCDTLSPKLDRLEDTGLTDCVVYANRQHVGGDFTVFYPAQWGSADGWGIKYLEPAMQAVEHADEVYGNYGVMRSIKIVFALNSFGTRAYANATPDALDGVAPCTVVVYALTSSQSITTARQLLAHEFFHCFSFWNFKEQWGADSTATRWWVEGSAEYFSNVAYPKVNFEWGRISTFDAESPTKPLTQMSYEACVFFQYLGNKIGNAEILNLLRSLPTSGGEAEQQAALRAFPHFAELFQDFAQKYLDRQIVDWGGELLPVKPRVKPVDPAIAATTSVKLRPDPFVVFRYAPVFAPKHAFSIGLTFPEGVTATAARDLDKVETWQRRLPESIDCDGARRFVVALTTITAEPADTTVQYVFTASDTPCDPPAGVNDSCLIGAWAVVDFENYLMAAYKASNSAAEVSFVGQEGSLVYLFASKDVTVVADDFKLVLEASIAGTAASIVITLNGTTTTSYSLSAKGKGSAFLVPGEIAVNLQVLLDGDEVYSDDASAFLQLIGGSFEYTCDGNNLELSTAGINGTMSPPVTLTRKA